MFTLSVDLGVKKITIPVADIQGKKEGKTLLVTAGVDGDEYASIDAAYTLIKEFQQRAFSGRLITIPIINIPGFFDEVSFNPMDKKYPKFIYPGKKDGSPTERMMYWLHTNFVLKSDVWLDLHGGSLTERIVPFLWIYQTKNKQGNDITNRVIDEASVDIAACITASPFGKAALLAKHNISYIIAESGHSAERKNTSIAKHVSWVKTTMAVLGMTNRNLGSKKKILYRNMHFYEAKKEGLWYPQFQLKKNVRKGTVLGEIKSLTGQVLQTFTAKEDGRLLWWKEGMAARKGDVLVAVGYNERERW